MPPRSERISFRVAPEELERIDRLAAQRNMNRTEYVILAALGRLDDAGEDFEDQDWRQKIEQRLGRIERLALGIDDG